MKAVCWHGRNDVRVETVRDPEILNPHDAVLKVSLTAICGSDLHLYDGVIPSMKPGDILGHEFMGEIVDIGSEVKSLKKGDRVVVPFNIACGKCHYCRNDLWSLCDNTNPNAWMAEKLYGFSGSGLFGYSHIFGGYAGGQAEYVRVPFADVGPMKIPEELPDERVLFLTDIFPTGYMAAENCDLKGGETVAIWGAGPVGQFALRSAFMLGAARVIIIDHIPSRLEMAKQAGAEIINYDDIDVLESLQELTGGRGPDACIDAVGMEAHGTGLDAWYDLVKQATKIETDRPTALRQLIFACGKGGVVSMPGVYGGFIDKAPMGSAFAKGLTFRMGQTHVHRYLRPLLERVQKGEIDPSFVITDRGALADAPMLYEKFQEKNGNCIKVVLKP